MMFLNILQNSQENTCARISFLIKLQVFSCEFCEIFKNTFFYRTPPVAASVIWFCSTVILNYFNPLMSDGNKSSYIVKKHAVKSSRFVKYI